MTTTCPNCKSSWSAAPGTTLLSRCPFCGASLVPSAPTRTLPSLERCLADLILEFGSPLLLDRGKLIGLVLDSLPQCGREILLIERFFDVHGNEVCLTALKKPQAEQDEDLELVVRRLIEDQYLNGTAARRICAMIWNAVGMAPVPGKGPRDPAVQTRPTDNAAQQMYQIGLRYEAGTSVRYNPILAAQFFRSAAERGHSEAQRHLGLLYETGTGVARSYGEAAKWYLAAAHQGDAQAQLLIARCYHYGNGVRRDPDEALRWCRLAAENGNVQAQKYYRKWKGGTA